MPSIRLASVLTFVFASSSVALAQPAVATSSAVTREAPAELTLSGEYRFVSGQDAIRRSIQAVCDRFDFITREIARPILEDRNRPYERVNLDVRGDGARFVLGDWGPVETRFGDTRTVTNERGERVRVRQIRVGDRLVQTLSTSEGSRRNVITVSADGRRLTVDTLITSPRLPIPLRYRLVYQRVEAPEGARIAMR
ncbi:MAG: hypothetical protein AB7S26_26295 [Sandaracinaceae bacterium]